MRLPLLLLFLSVVQVGCATTKPEVAPVASLTRGIALEEGVNRSGELDSPSAEGQESPVLDTHALEAEESPGTASAPPTYDGMDIPASFQFGEPIHESPNEYEECFILSRKAYKVYYCAELKISLWSAYAFRPTDHTSPRCERCFKEDPEYKMDPGKYPRMVHYANTYRKDLKGFDKGHQAPDAGLKVYGDAEQRETYYLSNMTPQYSLTNQGIWREWEDKVRQMATSEEPVWVITGPVLYKDREAKRLKGDSTGPVIPHGYFMIATRGWDEPDAVAILVENTDVRLSWRDNYKATLTTVDHIEELTGFDFLAELPDSVENVLEATPQDLWE